MADGSDHNRGFLNKVRILNAKVEVDLNRRLRRREIQAQLSESSTEETVTTNTLKLCSTFASKRTATTFQHSRIPRTRANPSRPVRCPDEPDSPNESYAALGCDDSDSEMGNSHSEASSHHDVVAPFPDDGFDSVDNTKYSNNETSGFPRPTPTMGSTDVSLFLKKVLKLVFPSCTCLVSSLK